MVGEDTKDMDDDEICQILDACCRMLCAGSLEQLSPVFGEKTTDYL